MNSRLEELDEVLSYLNHDRGVEAFSKIVSQFKGSFNDWRLEKILSKLEDDGYVDKVQIEGRPLEYVITFEGAVFSELGAYSKAASASQAGLRRDKLQWWMNLFLAVGATIAAVYYGLEILNHFYGVYPKPKP